MILLGTTVEVVDNEYVVQRGHHTGDGGCGGKSIRIIASCEQMRKIGWPRPRTCLERWPENTIFGRVTAEETRGHVHERSVRTVRCGWNVSVVVVVSGVYRNQFYHGPIFLQIVRTLPINLTCDDIIFFFFTML